MGRYFQHFHAKDFMKNRQPHGRRSNPGFGQTEWGPLFALLYEAEFSGSVAVEPHSALWAGPKREAGLRASYRYLSQFLLE